MQHKNDGDSFSLHSPNTPRRYSRRTFVLLFISLAVLASTASQKHEPQALTVDAATIDAAIHKAVIYLHHEYTPELALLRESPETAPNKHWLMTDNWLAATALSRIGETQFATQLCEAIKNYGLLPHGLVEAIAGYNIQWPPRTERREQPVPGVWREIRDQEEMLDWNEYSDLALYGALYHHNQGHLIESYLLYKDTIKLFDGVGFADKVQAAEGNYTTYKLALAVYVAGQLGKPVDKTILQVLLDKQLLSGGFSALYDEAGQPINDSNTETTAYALLALSVLQPNNGQTFACKIPDYP